MELIGSDTILLTRDELTRAAVGARKRRMAIRLAKKIVSREARELNRALRRVEDRNFDMIDLELDGFYELPIEHKFEGIQASLVIHILMEEQFPQKHQEPDNE